MSAFKGGGGQWKKICEKKYSGFSNIDGV
jgi:hypothetical protein